MDFLTATAYDLSFAKSLVDYDDKNLTKAMTFVFGRRFNLSGALVLHIFSDDGSSLVMKREIAKALEDDGSNDPPQCIILEMARGVIDISTTYPSSPSPTYLPTPTLSSSV